MSLEERHEEQLTCDRGYAGPDQIRAQFSSAMSEMYRREVPQYDALLKLVAQVNAAAMGADPSRVQEAQAARLSVERHGAIRLGTPHELATLKRIFAAMGMHPVGYYDLSVAGLPVHSTAFRPVARESTDFNPFRVFASLLRLELIPDPELRQVAAKILSSRSIYTARALELTTRYEQEGALTRDEAGEFVREVLLTFKWHGTTTVSRDTYRRLQESHRLLADVVCFQGPHINHLTPRTLDIDAVQDEMPRFGIRPKDVIEGPPRRRVPILLRQTSFKALQEPVRFPDEGRATGAHTARFGEVEQRGMALTRKGRKLYDELLGKYQCEENANHASADQPSRLANAFRGFPDDLQQIRRAGLGFFRYSVKEPGQVVPGANVDAMIEQGVVQVTPITYEDFLPVSAAGIFQSNLGEAQGLKRAGQPAQEEFEEALGVKVHDEFGLYEAEEAASLAEVDRMIRTEAPHAC